MLDIKHKTGVSEMEIKRVYKEFAVVGDYESYILGEKGVKKIEQHLPRGEGDVHYCTITFDNGNITQLFRPDYVEQIKDT
jgi:hypothetical protein